MAISTSAIRWLATLGIGLLGLTAVIAQGQQQRPTDSPPIVYVELHAFGFTPDTIRRPPGRFHLVIRNSSRRKNVNFKLQGAAGAVLKQRDTDRKEPRYRDLLELPAGDYLMTATHDKSHVLRISVR